MKDKVVVFWFRRDLRLSDNAGLWHAIASGYPVLPIFIFDPQILGKLGDKYDRRVDYIQQALVAIDQKLKEVGSGLTTFYQDPFIVLQQLLEQYDVQDVYCNRDYEPQAIQRDTRIYEYLSQIGIKLKAYKDQVIFDRNEILKADEKPYTVFSAYAKKWKGYLQESSIEPYEINRALFYQYESKGIHDLASIGFEKTDVCFEVPQLSIDLIQNYDKYRDYPGVEGTSRLGVALRFGTISIRECVKVARNYNEVWLSELIWREFFMQIMYHYPHVVERSFKPKYDEIVWRNDEKEFALWCAGNTGYPIVDAGMRELNMTGFMHNRVRMIVASFLCKHLLIDWRWGEAYFAEKLLDYDLSANNGNWQWAAGSGCDAVPYFRIFNPSLQTTRFDKDNVYIKKWLDGVEDRVSIPIVDHAFARERALAVYGKALKSN